MFNERWRRKERRSKQGQTNNKAKQHRTYRNIYIYIYIQYMIVVVGASAGQHVGMLWECCPIRALQLIC